MIPSVLQKHDIPKVWEILDALQVRADSLVYSRESPRFESQIESEYRFGASEQLEKVFGMGTLSNPAVDTILKEVHQNYLDLAKEILVVET